MLGFEGEDERAEMEEEADLLKTVLGVETPAGLTLDELREWVTWWSPSISAAMDMSTEERVVLKASGRWPPAVVRHEKEPPAIVRRFFH